MLGERVDWALLLNRIPDTVYVTQIRLFGNVVLGASTKMLVFPLSLTVSLLFSFSLFHYSAALSLIGNIWKVSLNNHWQLTINQAQN
jgi:hypothetical protein